MFEVIGLAWCLLSVVWEEVNSWTGTWLPCWGDDWCSVQTESHSQQWWRQWWLWGKMLLMWVVAITPSLSFLCMRHYSFCYSDVSWIYCCTGSTVTNLLCFADGMVLLTPFWNALQFLIDLLFIDYKLKLNLNKTFNIKKFSWFSSSENNKVVSLHFSLPLTTAFVLSVFVKDNSKISEWIAMKCDPLATDRYCYLLEVVSFWALNICAWYGITLSNLELIE